MANQEGVDIIIKATDQYTKTINNITASNDLFGRSIKNIEKEIAALENYMIKLVANGMKPTSGAVKLLQTNLDQLKGSLTAAQNAANGASNAIGATANNLKKSNQQYTNLALVLQDLPYGFRGIQNNLPALIGGFAGVGGAAYLAFSAIIAGFTFYDEALRKSASAAKKLKEEQASLNDEIIDSKQNALQQGYLLNQYVEIARNATLSDNTRNEALKKANEIYGEHNEKLTLANINTKAVKESLDGYIQSLIQMAVAQKYSDQVANNILKTDKLQSQIDKKKEQSYALLLEYTGKQTLASRDVVDVMYDRRVVEGEIAKLEQQKATNAKELITLTDRYSQSLLKATELSAKFGQVEEKKGGKTPEQLAIDKLKAIENANNAEIKAFTETLDERAKKEYEAGLKLANNLETMRAAGYTDSITYYAAYRAELDSIATFYNNKELVEAQKIADKVASIQLDMRFKMQNAISAINEKFATEDIKNNNTRLNATLKATRGNYQAQKEAIEEAIAKNEAYRQSAIEAGYGTEEFDKAAVNLKSQLEGLVDPLEEFNNSLRNILSSTFADLIGAFGEGFASMFNGGGMEEAMNNFLGILAEGLIQVGKLAIATGLAIEGIKAALKSLNPVLAIAAGIALIALGSYVKNSLSNTANSMGNTKKFANGGIISGPTMGLMGEYPGAASNPEVVAPLDKLQSLMGGMGGNLEARISGNDLLILMNKAGRNNQNTF